MKTNVNEDGGCVCGGSFRRNYIYSEDVVLTPDGEVDDVLDIDPEGPTRGASAVPMCWKCRRYWDDVDTSGASDV